MVHKKIDSDKLENKKSFVALAKQFSTKPLLKLEKDYSLWRILGLRIGINTFVLISSIFQIIFKSKFKTSFYDSKSKFLNVL